MTDTSRSCARCRRVAVVARGNAAYCIECNQLMEWSQVIAIVQNATEPTTPRVAHEPRAVAAASAESVAEAIAPVAPPAPSDVVAALTAPSDAAPVGDETHVDEAQGHESNGLIKDTVLPGSSGEPALAGTAPAGASSDSAEADPFAQRLV